MNFLERMRMLKTAEAEEHSLKAPLGKLGKSVKKAKHAFAKALKQKGRVSLIAEFKRASPSKGKINGMPGLEKFARLYDEYADAISVLTEKEYFCGNLGDLKAFRKISKKPILQKDFIINEYQIYEARAAGADAILLIAGLLGKDEIDRLIAVADKLGMDALAECFDEEGLKTVLASRAKIIGINNRNLITMEEDASKAARFIPTIPAGRRGKSIIVAESSIFSSSQVESLMGKADAVLAGTSIMSAASPRAKLRELAGKTLVKICGTTSVEDAINAVKLGADVIGLNFYEKSPRFVNVQAAKEIADAVRGSAAICGVFVNERAERVEIICREAGIGMVQFSGDESPQYVNSFKLPSIKVLHVRNGQSLDNAGDYSTGMVMLDSSSGGLYGGTGKRFDENLADSGKLAGKQIVISGGLNAQNVKGIIKKFRPFMVDVCSGVEEKPGKKSLSKMRGFMKSVRGVVK